MNTSAPHKIIALVAVALSAIVATTPPSSRAGDAKPQSLTITYVAHNGSIRAATVLLPAGYRRGDGPIPLVISPHGRGATGKSNAKFWGNLPTIGGFAVVNPDGEGRRTDWFSYGFSGQIDDLARMPQIIRHALPWVRIDGRRVYALGSSMGGQETLLLVARHPGVLAGAVAMDSVTDLALRYRQVLQLPTKPVFVKHWGAPEGVCLQHSMKREVGGTPTTNRRGYAERSPLSQAAAIAASGVPLEIWWSRLDRIVMHQETQSRALYRRLRELGTRAPVTARVGTWAHSKEMRSTALLPVALTDLGLLPEA
jgi:poly(3-hydroxybutyrate) depolymerase